VEAMRPSSAASERPLRLHGSYVGSGRQPYGSFCDLSTLMPPRTTQAKHRSATSSSTHGSKCASFDLVMLVPRLSPSESFPSPPYFCYSTVRVRIFLCVSFRPPLCNLRKLLPKGPRVGGGGRGVAVSHCGLRPCENALPTALNADMGGEPSSHLGALWGGHTVTFQLACFLIFCRALNLIVLGIVGSGIFSN
jgi:hypothetical protein